MANKSSLKVRKEHRREGPAKEVKLQREAIPSRGATTEKAQFCIVEVWAKGFIWQ
jgi:hypothetical protein